MPFKNKDNDLCGYLDRLSSSNLNIRVRRFAMVKHGTPSMLELYFEKFDNGSLERDIDLAIDLSQTPMVMQYEGDDDTMEHIFYLNYNDEHMYFAAENDQDRDGWCDVLSSEILHSGSNTTMSSTEDVLVPLKAKPKRKKHNFMETFLSNRTHSLPNSFFFVPAPNTDENHRDISSFANHQHKIGEFFQSRVFKTGICNKKDGYQSAWHERFFVLNIDGLFYFKCNSDPYLLGFIRYEDIVTCRQSQGVFPHVKNLFEVVTRKKVYYCQTDTADDRDDWVSRINSNNTHNVRLSLMNNTSFDDDIIVYSF